MSSLHVSNDLYHRVIKIMTNIFFQFLKKPRHDDVKKPESYYIGPMIYDVFIPHPFLFEFFFTNHFLSVEFVYLSRSSLFAHLLPHFTRFSYI